ncbi:MAG: universal stress protein [Candidatus Omnitrophica bacterium]|nr:universal stress protein [Candidatus Omnitrophota bacterium]
MYKKILVPLDISRTDTRILEHIRPLARFTGAKIILVHVADGFSARLQSQLDLSDSEEVLNDRKSLEAAVAMLRAEGFSVHGHLLKGDPVSAILSLAEEEGCDLIAMATHGHNHLADWFFGSVADGLRHRTGIPILMVSARIYPPALKKTDDPL